MRDLRDPTKLGTKLLHAAEDPERTPDVTLSMVADHTPLHVPDYDHNPGPLEKYGDPRLLPSTMP